MSSVAFPPSSLETSYQLLSPLLEQLIIMCNIVDRSALAFCHDLELRLDVEESPALPPAPLVEICSRLVVEPKVKWIIISLQSRDSIRKSGEELRMATKA